jgi:hypothetical protein
VIRDPVVPYIEFRHVVLLYTGIVSFASRSPIGRWRMSPKNETHKNPYKNRGYPEGCGRIEVYIGAESLNKKEKHIQHIERAESYLKLFSRWAGCT